MELYDVLVIGAGQAGLAMGYELQQLGLHFILLEAGDATGQSWRNRYDSLRLFTTSRYNSLTGMAFPGPADRFPTKDDVADYLAAYAAHFSLPIDFKQQVLRLEHDAGCYTIYTQERVYKAQQVVISTGAFHKPSTPAFASNIGPHVKQFHSSQYRHPTQLAPGKVLVVGGGNSGVQIAEELLAEGRHVYFACRGRLKAMPNSTLTMRLLFGLGLVHLSKYSWLGRRMMLAPERIIGTNLNKLLAHPNLTLIGPVTTAAVSTVKCAEMEVEDAANIIWSTGFKSDFNWVELPVFDAAGQPVHERGVTAVAGLYFLGLPWLHSRSSGLLGGVARDAAYLSRKIVGIKVGLAKGATLASKST